MAEKLLREIRAGTSNLEDENEIVGATVLVDNDSAVEVETEVTGLEEAR